MPDHDHGKAHSPPLEKTDEKTHASATHVGPAAPPSGAGKEDKPDRFGEELADDAHVWRVYGRVAKEEDNERVQRWNGGLNNLALFAALFSGITTTFIIESQNDLKPDFSELAYRVQNATAHGRAYVEEPFIISVRARVVNCLWLASLLLSLSAALIAIMGQDWIEMYVDRPVCNPRQWAEIRTFRMNGLEKWYMPGVIATAPVLLHSSLFLFGAGLIVFMAADTVTQNLCIALCATTAWLYAVTMFSPVLWSSSPFRSPATLLMRRWFCAMFGPNGDAQNRPSVEPSAPDRSARVTNGGSATLIASPGPSPARTPAGVVTSRLDGSIRPAAGGDGSTVATTGDPLTARRESLPRATSVPNQGVPTGRDSYDAEKAQPCSQARCSTLHSSNPGWPHRLYSKFLAAFEHFFQLYSPDYTNAWIDIPKVPSPTRVTHSLSWLYTASSSPDVPRAVVTALGDLKLGQALGKDQVSQRVFEKVFEKIHKAVEDNVDTLSLLELSRYVLVSRNLRRGDWPEHVTRRFRHAMTAEADNSPFPEDSLLALVYLTNGLQHRGKRGHDLSVGPPRLQALCARIAKCSPITFQAVVSALPTVHSEELVKKPFPFSGTNLIVLMNRWRDGLPPDLANVELALRGMLSEAPAAHEKDLGVWCSANQDDSDPRPIDNIIHLLVAALPCLTAYPVTLRSAVDLIAYLARTAADAKVGERKHTHTCLAEVFGSVDTKVTEAAWEKRQAREIQFALFSLGIRLWGRHTSPSLSCDPQLRPSLARMLVRHVCPPFALLSDDPSGAHRPPQGALLCQLVQSLGAAAPVDLFLPILQTSALVSLAEFNRQSWYVLTAVCLWIDFMGDAGERRRLFGLFISSPARDDGSAAWTLSLAIAANMERLDQPLHCSDQMATSGIPKDQEHPYRNRSGSPGNKTVGETGHGHAQNPQSVASAPNEPPEECFAVALRFMGALEGLRTAFPESALWADIARSIGYNSAKCPRSMWPEWRQAVQKATGFDPSQFVSAGEKDADISAHITTMHIKVPSPTSGQVSDIHPSNDPEARNASAQVRVKRQPFSNGHRAIRAPP